MNSRIKILSWVLQGLSALIMLETLFYKFTGAEESVYIFSILGVEPWGRYLSGIMELIAAVLLLIPSLAWLGALLGVAIMSGAVASHAFFLGFEIMNDGGLLFTYACIVLISSFIIIFIRRNQIPKLINI